MVINIESTVKSIQNAVESAELMSGREVHGVYTGVAGGHIEGINSRGVVAVTGKDREITKEDVDRVIDAAKAIVIPMDREVLHVIPQEFIVDQQGGIKNPVGMVGVRLEAEAHIITGAVTSAQNIVKCVNRAGFKVNDIVLEPLASSKAVLTADEQELGVLLIDLGGGTTDVLVHLEGAPYHTEVLSIGGEQVTSDLSIMLKTPLEVAEKIKKEHGCCYVPAVLEDDAGRDLGRGQRSASRGHGCSRRWVADLTLENRVSKSVTGMAGRRMRYLAAEKLEIIQLVEQLDRPVRRRAGADRHPEIDVLSMVRSLSDWRARGAGRLQPSA